MMEIQPGSGLSKFVLFFGGAVLVALGVATGAFLFSGGDVSRESKVAGAVSETFRDVLGFSGERQPVLEIDLRQEEAESLPEETEIAVAPVTGKSKPAVQEEQETAVLDCEFDSPMLRSGQAASSASRGVIFNEIAWMGTEANANDEWLELKNVSGGEVSLSGWQMLSQDERIKFSFPDAALKPGGFFLLERTDDESLPDIKADAIYTGLLPNGGSWLKLFDRDCDLADEINASGGWTGFGGDRTRRTTLERNTGNLGWHTSSIVGGTPRKENSEPAPVQQSASPSQISAPPPPQQVLQSTSVAGKININTAGLEELDKITGVGPVIAQRIIDYRRANGPFQKIEDIKEVKGIGDATFEKMRNEITI